MGKYFVYDLETLLNFFSFAGKYKGEDDVYFFEISERKNQLNEMLAFLARLHTEGTIMVGYNSLGFDYPILHQALTSPHTFTYTKAYETCKAIIGNNSYGNAFGHTVRFKDRIIPQLDLVKINHFDNANKRVSLKSLQFAMRSESVEDIPVPLDVKLTHQEMDTTKFYNIHDVTETEKFLIKCEPLIKLRQDIVEAGTLKGDVLNYSDVKLGEQMMVNRLGRNNCYQGSKPKQTVRYFVPLKEVILPKIQFEEPDYQEVLDWFKQQTVRLTGTRPHLEKQLAGLTFDFGLGGVHASVDSKVYHSSESHVILDIDVASMYVSVAIANGFYPEHLGKNFVTAYKAVRSDRKQYPKTHTNNKTLKLAGNGVFGNSNNQYSPFFDTKYTYAVTCTGQLQLLQLIEMLFKIPNLDIIQANTDGTTLYMRRDVIPFFKLWCTKWEQMTGLELEEVEYKSMWIRDVNNYVAETMDGKMKRKGAYWYPECDADYEGQWNKDFSSMCVPKATSLCLKYNMAAEYAIRLVTDPFDFMLRYKTPGGATVYIGDVAQPKTVRYFISKSGQPMKKISKPKGELGQFKRKNKLHDEYFYSVMAEIGKDVWDERIHTKNKSKYTETTTSIKSGRLVTCCNKASDFNWNDLDYDYYVEEVKKLLIGE